MKHLHNADFYSTLESLRTTSRELRAQPATPEQVNEGVSCKLKQHNKKCKKVKKKAPSIPPLILPERSTPTPDVAHSTSCLSEEYEKCVRDLSRLANFKQDFALEVADFKQSLKAFEQEFMRKAERPKSTSNATQTHKITPMPKVPAMHTAERAKVRSEMLKKSYSVNDLSASGQSAPKLGLLTQSNYFSNKEVPKLHIESPSVSSKRSSNSSTSTSRRVCRRRSRKIIVAPVQTTIQEPLPGKRISSVSPQHPVARPNLAATLRAEVSRKKVKELKNNCTYHDPIPQFDWEVRKTPAWKSLSLK